MRMVLVLVAAVLLMAALPCGAVQYRYADLVSRLADLEELATLPGQGETCKQWSSYDRASRYDGATGKYVGWDANWDGSGTIRKEGDQQVFAEMEGPGCIWRIWSALAKGGHVKIYLDGATEPAVDLAFDGYFNGQNAPFNFSGLVHDTSQGRNCYIPIPYQKSCKIVGEGDWGAYFEFNYTTFPKEGTVVPTFTRDLDADSLTALSQVSLFLTKQLGTDPDRGRDKQVVLAPTVDLAPGQTAVVADIPGPEAITCLRAKISEKKFTEEQLRSVVLKIYWDGEKEPSVWCPIGDFFGSGYGLKPYKSLPLGVTEDDAYSYWYMPFAKEARIELANEGTSRFSTQFYITYAPLERPIKQLGRFHAKWHRDAFLPAEPERWIDWTILKTEGRGRFCGVALEVWNPRGGWWGEGDEKWFVDGEKFPSTIGTGSEDYFGYAWCNPHLFQNAYHNQTRNDNLNNTDHITVNRWQIAENIPFQKSFDGYIEKYFANNRPTHYAAVAYWYLSADGQDPYKPVPVKYRLNWYVRPVVKTIPGVTEGEALKLVGPAAGSVEPQMLDERWSNNTQLWWISHQPNGRITLNLPVKKAGRYAVSMQFTKAIDYGIFQLSLDGKPIGRPIDLCNDGVIPSGAIGFGEVELDAGDHQLMVLNVGKNEKSTSYLFGLDYIKLQRVK